MSQIQDFVNSYERIFIYSLENSRNNKLKDLRAEFKDDSRFYLGKNKLCQVAFGKSKELEAAEGLHKFSQSLGWISFGNVDFNQFIAGETGLLFTNKKEEEVVEYFNKYNSASYARVGEKSEVTVKVLQNLASWICNIVLGRCWAAPAILFCDRRSSSWTTKAANSAQRWSRYVDARLLFGKRWRSYHCTTISPFKTLRFILSLHFIFDKPKIRLRNHNLQREAYKNVEQRKWRSFRCECAHVLGQEDVQFDCCRGRRSKVVF